MTEEQASAILKRNANASGLDSHPQLKRYVECFLETFILKGRLDPQLRELTILRIAWRCAQPYEWAQHYRRAREEGVGDEDVLAIRCETPDQLGKRELQMAAQAVDEVLQFGYMQPDTYKRCADYFDDPALTHEFLHLVAGYRMMATILNTTRPDAAAAGLLIWPPDGIGPGPQPIQSPTNRSLQ